MIFLFDYDSLIYKSCSNVVSFTDIRGWLENGKNRVWIEKEIVSRSINKLIDSQNYIFEAIEDTGIEMEEVEYYVTTCKKSFRKKLNQEYKANRKKHYNRLTKWVSLVRKELIENMNYAIGDDYFEADDLVITRALQLGPSNCVILSLDKDLRQIEGIFFDYGTKINNDGSKDYKGLEVISKLEAKRFFWKQMLMGDSGDNIKGIKGIGPVKANKILDQISPELYFHHTLGEYCKHYGFDADIHFHINYELLKIGIRKLKNGLPIR